MTTPKFDMQAMRDKIKAKTTEITKATEHPAPPAAPKAPPTPPTQPKVPVTPPPAGAMSPVERAKALAAANKAKREAEAKAEEEALLAAAMAEEDAVAATPEVEASLGGVDTTPINPPGEFQTEAEGVANEAADAAAKVEAKAAKKGPGRPRKSAAPPPAASTTETDDPVSAPSKGFVLCIDVALFGDGASGIMLGEELFGAVDAVFLDTHGQADYRFIDYGKGAGLWQECLRQIVDSGALDGRVVVLSSVCAETSIAMVELAPRATSVFRSMR